jgi:hypothetical protein
MRTSFIRAELERVLADRSLNQASVIGLRAALHLLDVLADHHAASPRAEALKVALSALGNAYRADWSVPAPLARAVSTGSRPAEQSPCVEPLHLRAEWWSLGG